MKKYILQILLCLLLFITLFFNLYVFKTNSKMICLAALAIFLLLSIAINRYRSPNKRDLEDVLLIISGLSILLITFFYMLGLKTGFIISYNSIFRKYITASTWIQVFIIVILVEISRYVISQMFTKDKKQRWILDGVTFLCFCLVDLTIVTKTYDYTIFNQLYEFVALVLVQSVAKNVLLMNVSRKYGIIPCLAYRLIIDLYVYFLPIVPKINMFIESVILLIFPYMVHICIKKMLGKKELGPIKQEKKHDRIVTFFTTLVFIVLVALVSREFTYCMIAIGSESMTGTANKGDAIIYRVYDLEKDKLKKDDIIVFLKNNVTVVHRIYSIEKINGTEVYKTKGDANESVDNWIVEKKDVVGVVKSRIVYIGWPSVWLSEIF